MTEEERLQIIKEVVSGLIPATAGQIGAGLGNLSRELGRVNKEWTASRKVVRKLTRDYQNAFDLVFIRLTNPPDEHAVRLPVEVAKAMARVDSKVYGLGLELDAAKNDAEKLKTDFEELQDRIRVGQTNASTVRSEHRNVGYGGTP